MTFRAPRLREIDAEFREESLTGRGDFPNAVDGPDKVAAEEHVAYCDAQAPRHMVVAHTRFLERRLDAMMGRPAVGWGGRHRHQPLDGLSDLRRAQTVVVAAALLLHRQQVAGE